MTIWLPTLWSQLYVTVLVNTFKGALRPQRANIPPWSVISNPELSRNPNQNSLFSAAVHLSVWSAALCFLSTLDLLLFTQFLCPPVTPTTLILHQPVFSGCCPLPNRLCIFPPLSVINLTVWFFCCFPPSPLAPARFDEVLIRHQVKYLGLMENLRVRRAGFAYRRRYEVFLQRWCQKTSPHNHTHVGAVNKTIEKTYMEPNSRKWRGSSAERRQPHNICTCVPQSQQL